jgi:tRNA pseudouridine38-40 synthase
LERALGLIHKTPTPVHGSGRTDSGVHAAGQVAHFHSPLRSIPADRYARAMNALLPRDCRVLESREARPDFHARFDAKSRTYRYHIVCGRPALPHESRYALQLWRRPDIGRLNAMASFLRGEIDCTTFATPSDPSESRSRFFFRARFHTEGDTLVFEVTANAFLWKMVRSIVGTLLHLEERGAGAEDFYDLVRAKDRRAAGPTAPPEGLFLWRVDYYREIG